MKPRVGQNSKGQLQAMMQHPGVHAFMVRYFTEDGHPVKGVQKDIAHACGVTPATVSRWFAGATKIDPTHWRILAEVAGTDTDTVRRYVTADPAVVGPDEILFIVRAISARLDTALEVAAAERRDLEAALHEVARETAVLAQLVRDAIAERRNHNSPALPAPRRSQRGSSRSHA